MRDYSKERKIKYIRLPQDTFNHTSVLRRWHRTIVGTQSSLRLVLLLLVLALKHVTWELIEGLFCQIFLEPRLGLNSYNLSAMHVFVKIIQFKNHRGSKVIKM